MPDPKPLDYATPSRTGDDADLYHHCTATAAGLFWLGVLFFAGSVVAWFGDGLNRGQYAIVGVLSLILVGISSLVRAASRVVPVPPPVHVPPETQKAPPRD